ncbi:MAG: DNA-processing protein DprA [Oscillospiraceae bacterium]
MADLRACWLWLQLVFEPANPRIWQLSVQYDDVSSFVSAALNGRLNHLTENEQNKIHKYTLRDAEKLLDYCEKNGYEVCCYDSEKYPQRLKMINNPPAVLYVKGKLDFLNDMVYIAVVGSRKPSDYSVRTTKWLCSDLLKSNVRLISGFADGIDRIANEVSIENNVPSLAVCGRPLNEDYPKGSSDVKQKIIENGGAVISEYYPGCKAFKCNFTNRNRILVGLSDGVLFCECSSQSHGLDNEKYAYMQGKLVFAVPPHDLSDKRYFGQRKLLRAGAIPVFDSSDIIYNLRLENSDMRESIGTLSKYKLSPLEDDEQPQKPKIKNKKHKQNKKEYNEQKADVNFQPANDMQKEICSTLAQSELTADDIADILDEDIAQILTELMEMEIQGAVSLTRGMYYKLNK